MVVTKGYCDYRKIQNSSTCIVKIVQLSKLIYFGNRDQSQSYVQVVAPLIEH